MAFASSSSDGDLSPAATGTTSMFSFSLRHIVPSTEIPTRHCPVLLNEPHCDQPRNLSNDLGWNPFLPIMHPKFDQLDTGGTALQLLYKDKGSKTAQPLNVSWESCAVVSSSEVLLKSGFGRQIDEHSAVIRFNEAPAGGRFARDVGSRTTIRLQNGQRCGFSDSKPAEYCLGFTGAGVHCQNKVKCKFLEPQPRLEAYLRDYWTHHTPPRDWLREDVSGVKVTPGGKTLRVSGGFGGVLVAMNLCKRVTVYGLGGGARGNHYFKKEAGVKTKASSKPKPWVKKHHFAFEAKATVFLAAGGVPGVLAPGVK
eukprot:gene22233-26811_t